MKEISLGNSDLKIPAVAVGCMRLADKTKDEMNDFIHHALENNVNFFDHADIYAQGKSEELFGDAIKNDATIKREDIIIQSKCGIRFEGRGFYDQSKEYIISSVEKSLKRLGTDYLDVLLLHRPDALVEPEEVAEAFEELKKSGKVKFFGVSNHKPMQIELLKKYVKEPILVNQMQFSIPVSNMVSNGMEVNMDSKGSVDHDGSVLDYCRFNDITLQAWSPFQRPNWKGCFLDCDEYEELNKEMEILAEKYKVTKTTIATSWILRHPANMQVISGTTSKKRLKEIIEASNISLTRKEWYDLYLAAGHILP